MALCPSCGNSISDSFSFCPHCSTKLETETSPAGAYNTSTREGTLALMHDVKNLYNRLSDKFSLLVSLTNENANLKTGRTKAWIAFMIITLCTSLVTIFTCVSMSFATGEFTPEISLLLLIYVLPFLILFLVYYRKDRKGAKGAAIYSKNKETIDAIADEILDTYYQQELSNHYPLDYFYEEAIDSLIKYLSSFRATSLTEALNLFETEAHQRRLEEQQKQLLVQQQRVLLAQKELILQAKLTGSKLSRINDKLNQY